MLKIFKAFKRENKEVKSENKALYARFDSKKAPEFEFDKYIKDGTLITGAFYKVKNVDIDWSTSNIELEGVQGYFNALPFDFYMVENGNMKPHDIYKDPRYNPYYKPAGAGNGDASSEPQPNM